jgi:hypothetical protein
MKKTFMLMIVLGIVLILNGCGGGNNTDNKSTTQTKQFGIFKVLNNNITIEMDGEINSESLYNFNKLHTLFPLIEKINIVECDGSSDDEINLLLSHKVHQLGINIHLLDNSEITSGSVDFFLAGIQRTRGNNTRIGVHSWANDDEEYAIDFPRGHSEHLPYINYFISIGMTQQEAEDFYYFTIYAAEADSIHWMTEYEIEQYGLITL